jgi:pyruvate dehydrogenase E2 component (dihydrolipoamide acetyltransferase)
MNSREVELSNVHKIMSKRMKKSWTEIPQFQLSAEIDLTDLYYLRNNYDNKPSYTAIFTKAIGDTILNHPYLNSSWQEEKLIQYDQINIGIAMDTSRGLIVPVVNNVSDKSLWLINEEIEELKKQAVEGHIALEKLRGGTFTISNLGMYRVSSFNAMINPPEAAIMAFPRIKTKQLLFNDEIKEKKIMTPTLTVDHRAADGAKAARFLTQFVELLENPESLF